MKPAQYSPNAATETLNPFEPCPSSGRSTIDGKSAEGYIARPSDRYRVNFEVRTHLALARAVDNGFQMIAGEASHKQLWRNYSESPDYGCKKLAEIAKRLKEKRERADYNKVYLRINDEVNELIDDAQDFAARLVALPGRFPAPAHVRQ
jgi:hypothetical protein